MVQKQLPTASWNDTYDRGKAACQNRRGSYIARNPGGQSSIFSLSVTGDTERYGFWNAGVAAWRNITLSFAELLRFAENAVRAVHTIDQTRNNIMWWGSQDVQNLAKTCQPPRVLLLQDGYTPREGTAGGGITYWLPAFDEISGLLDRDNWEDQVDDPNTIVLLTNALQP